MLETQVLSSTDDDTRARVEVTEALKQPLGLVHGAVFAPLAAQLTATTTSRAISSQTSFLRPITGGHVNATARRRHSGRTTALWEVDMTDDEARLCALVRVTLALTLGSASAAGTRS